MVLELRRGALKNVFTLHCTAKLLVTLKRKPSPKADATTRLGNWYANHLDGPRSRIVCVSERTYLPVVLERAAVRELPRALGDALAPLLGELGVPAPLIEQERFAMAQCAFARTESRSLVGVLNEQAFMAGTLLVAGVSPAAFNRRLADNIVKSQFPVDLTRAAFGLAPESRRERRSVERPALALKPLGDWDPAEEYWGDEAAPPAWALPIIARGPRPAFAMEQVIPGEDPTAWDDDPIYRSVELKHAGRAREARQLLESLLAEDVRCIDAHAHLGNLIFEADVKAALAHYRAGVAIGDAALGPDFDGVLSWGHEDNRPYLRALVGVGLCAWRLGCREEAVAVFSRMLWLNPGDNQGARFNLEDVVQGRAWQPDR